MAATQCVTIADIQAMDTVAITQSVGARAVGVDPRTFAQGVSDGTIPSVKIGRRVLIPRLPFLALFGAADGVAINPVEPVEPVEPVGIARIGGTR